MGYLVCNCSGLNPPSHLIWLNVISHQYCCAFFVSHSYREQALLLATGLNSTGIYACQVRRTKHLLCQVQLCIPTYPPAHCSVPTTPVPAPLSSRQAPTQPAQVLLSRLPPELPGSCSGGLPFLVPQVGNLECAFRFGKHQVKQNHSSYFHLCSKIDDF